MNVMEIGLSSMQQIGTNYSIRLNSREVLVFEKDKTPKIEKTEPEEPQKKEASDDSKKPAAAKELSMDEKRVVSQLQARDAEVRSHEAAHQSGGASTGAASYTYQQGPDGKMYAIGGEVSVSFSSGSTPEETIANAQAVIASAMAPGNPSGQDFAVASSARMMIIKAQQQKTKELQQEMKGHETYKNEAAKNSDTAPKESSKIDTPA